MSKHANMRLSLSAITSVVAAAVTVNILRVRLEGLSALFGRHAVNGGQHHWQAEGIARREVATMQSEDVWRDEHDAFATREFLLIGGNLNICGRETRIRTQARQAAQTAQVWFALLDDRNHQLRTNRRVHWLENQAGLEELDRASIDLCERTRSVARNALVERRENVVERQLENAD